MQQRFNYKLKRYFLWFAWILIIQMALANISAAIYAYKFTHFYTDPPPYQPNKNVLAKTWKLFVGPRVYKLSPDSITPQGYERLTLHTANNVPIDSWYAVNDSAKGCIIFFHGITAHKSVLFKEAEQFKLWGYNVLLVDFRGHGNSGGNKSSFGVKETDEVQKAFAFAQSKGNKNIILYGSSLGSVVIIKAVAEKKVQPQAIIADMPFGSLQDHLKARARVLGFPSEPFAFLVTLWIGIENGYNGFTHQTYSYAKDIDCPILVEWGTRDMYVTENEIKDIYQNLPASNKKLIIYPDANHESYLQYDLISWQKNMHQFLNTLPQ